MNRREVSEIKKQFSPSNCNISRICGCYVNGEKDIIATFKDAFLSLPEEVTFKYFEIFKKTLSGSLGKCLHDIEFPLAAEKEGGAQESLLKLRDSALKDDELLKKFYRRVIDTYCCVGNFLILIIHGSYDIPGKSNDGETMFDASDEVYNYILCSICPMSLDKPGLAYNEKDRKIENKDRDWVADMPLHGFLFPAFNDRSSDIHGGLYYTKKSHDMQDEFFAEMFGATVPMSDDEQQKAFSMMIEETFGNELDFKTAKAVNDNLMEHILEHECSAEKYTLDKRAVKELLEESGADEKQLERFEETFEDVMGKHAGEKTLIGQNLLNTARLTIKSDDVVVTAKQEYGTGMETKIIDGRRCLVIELSGNCTVNGIPVN